MTFVLVGGTTETARIDGISAAGSDPDLMVHTPAADMEILTGGQPGAERTTPVSPTGCPTPAVVTRAVRDLIELDVVCVDAGLATSSRAPTVSIGTDPGADIRDPVAVPSAGDVFDRGRSVGRSRSADELIVGETIPGGTTTALGVLRALGEPYRVSSSLRDNPVALKRRVVERGLDASDLGGGDARGDPDLALRTMGDPVLAGIAGLARGHLESGGRVTLAGGTQMLAAAALLRHQGISDPIGLATTPFVAGDETADLRDGAAALDVDLTVTDPGFDRSAHPALASYQDGVAKEGVGMGGALMLAARRDVSMAAVRGAIVDRYDTLVSTNGSEHRS